MNRSFDRNIAFNVIPKIGDFQPNLFTQEEMKLQNESRKILSNKKINFSFTPHLTPMFRGILTTIYVDMNKNITQDKIYKTLINFYKNDYFIKIMSKNTYLSTNDVINTNYCKISVCKSKYKNKLIILSSIDNLIKGGSGQAIQNMNKKFNFPEKMGLI